MFGMHNLMVDTAIITGAATLLGAVVVFFLLYLVLERKKKSLVGVLLAFLAGYGIFYWYIGSNNQASLDVPKTVVTERIVKPVQGPVPLPAPRPRVKKQAAPPITVCPRL